ncbi:hypothetical protein B0H10DRAFT_491755 [Mycena sp. CBHHK59/15]|nr:hypothetical protein B0H10DRAFT_491755 [Mycena sp. CBHHK59/15]
MRQDEDAVVFRRDRPVERDRKLKVTTINLRDDVQKLWAALEAQGDVAAKERETAAWEREATAEEMCKEHKVAAKEREAIAEEMRKEHKVAAKEREVIVEEMRKEREVAAKEREAFAEEMRKERETAAREREAAVEEMRARVADAEASSIFLLKVHIDDIDRKLPDMEVVEEYKVVSLLLRGLNDRLFDVNRRDQAVTQAEKDVLKKHKLRYITHLLTFCLPPATGKQKLIAAFEKAKGLLTTEEWDLCLILNGRLTELRVPQNALQHPRPDREAVCKQMEVVAPTHTVTVANLLASNLQQMRTAEDTDRRLIVDASEYHGPAEERALRAELVEVLRRLEARQAEDVKTGAKRRRSDSVL